MNKKAGSSTTIEVYLKAYAKINLTLDVFFKRKDGYHELRTVMHSVDIFDTLHVTKNNSHSINVLCSTPLPEKNTAYRAANLFMKHTRCGGVNIEIIKGIPSEAGMGGASADAAGVLKAMEQLYGKISKTELYDIACSVGADVPFCLQGGCALAEGIGERLTLLNPIELPLLIVKGKRGISTGELFKALKLPVGMNATDSMLAALSTGDISIIALRLNNSLMHAAEERVKEITEQREKLLACGALGACMTGSGAAVYGIFASESAARSAAHAFCDTEFYAVCRSCGSSIEILDADNIQCEEDFARLKPTKRNE